MLEGSSAAKAGIKVGDRVTRVAGSDTPDVGRLREGDAARGRPRDRGRAGPAGRASRRCNFTPDLIEKYHAADLGVRPMLHMRVGTVYAG